MKRTRYQPPAFQRRPSNTMAMTPRQQWRAVEASVPDVDARIESLLRVAGREPVAALSHALVLSRSHRVSAKVRKRVELATITHALGSYETLSSLIPFLADHWPVGLLNPCLRSAMHVGLEAGHLDVATQGHFVRAILADDTDVHRVVQHPEQASLATRLRVATTCVSVGLAEASGASGPIQSDDQRYLLSQALVRLFEDRDPVVGVRAAWAMGALRVAGRLDPEAHRLLHLESPSGRTARRAFAARVAELLLSGDDEGSILTEMRDGLGKRDLSSRVVAIRALTLGIPLAPSFTCHLVTRLIEGGTPDIYAMAARYAHLQPDEELSKPLVAEIRKRAKGDDCADYPPLRFFIGPRPPRVERLCIDLSNLRKAARISPGVAHKVAKATLDGLQLAGKKPTALDDQAFDEGLIDTTLLRDALRVGDRTTKARAAAFEALVGLFAQARHRRLKRLTGKAASREQRRACLWWVSRALDASPRGLREGPDDPAAEEFGRHALEAVQEVLAHLGRNEDGMLDRPCAVALVTALEAAIGSGALRASDAALTFALVPSRRVLRYCADVGSMPSLVRCARAHLAVTEALTMGSRLGAKLSSSRRSRRASERKRRVQQADEALLFIEDAMRQLCDAVNALTLGERDSAYVALSTLVAVVAGFRDARRDAPGYGLRRAWLEVLEAFRRLGDRLGKALALHDRVAVVSTPPSNTLSNRVLPPLLREAGFPLPRVPPKRRQDDEYGSERARKVLRKAMPVAFSSFFDVLLSLPRASATTTPPSESRTAFPHGKRIGDYAVERTLGEGGMGYCLLVRRRLEADNPNAKRFVMKLPRGRDTVELFREEARTLIGLSKRPHQGVVPFLAFVDYGYRLPFLLMEFVEGRTLSALLESRSQSQPVSAPMVRAMGQQLAGALAHCHDNVFHPGGSRARLEQTRDGLTRVSGLTGMAPAAIGLRLRLSGATRHANCGAFLVLAVDDQGSVWIRGAETTGERGEHNNGHLTWDLRDPDNGVAHQDLKPDNIILRGGALTQPVLVDWGIAGADLLRRSGTPPYMAPERWDPNAPPQAAAPSDVFALAATLYETVVGRPLLGPPVSPTDFPDDPDLAALIMAMAEEYQWEAAASELAKSEQGLRHRIRNTVGQTDAALGALLCEMVASDPAARPDAASVRDQLAAMA